MRESLIEKHLVKRVKELGGEVRKVQWVGRRGAPDRAVLRNADQAAADTLREYDMACMTDSDLARVAREIVGLYISWPELKATGIKPEAHQLREHGRMRAMG